jgi:hypothetical protein
MAPPPRTWYVGGKMMLLRARAYFIRVRAEQGNGIIPRLFRRFLASQIAVFVRGSQEV